MMKKILLPALLLAAFPAAAEEIAEDCTFGGVPLYGNVRIVEHFGDFKVRKVEHFGDLKVKYSPFGTDCGEWRLVDVGEDLRLNLSLSAKTLPLKKWIIFPVFESGRP